MDADMRAEVGRRPFDIEPRVSASGREKAGKDEGSVLADGVLGGTRTCCGGRAVFRQVEAGEAVGACFEGARTRCWWAGSSPESPCGRWAEDR